MQLLANRIKHLKAEEERAMRKVTEDRLWISAVCWAQFSLKAPSNFASIFVCAHTDIDVYAVWCRHRGLYQWDHCLKTPAAGSVLIMETNA